MYSNKEKLRNKDLLWEEIEAKKTFLTHLPPRITFQTHQRCNFSCRFCYHFYNKYYEGVDPMTMGCMSLDHIKKIADELFPTLQFYEATLLGDPFLSPNFDEEMKLCRQYNVYFRPTTNASLLTEEKLEQVDGVMDWFKCSFDSHIRSVYNYIKIGVRYEKVVEKLKMFAEKRYEMSPVPYFRMGFVLTDLNMEHLPEYMIWCRDELGVDDIEVMGLNVDHYHIEAMGVFDEPDRVNECLERAIQTALDRKIRLTLPFLRIPGEGATGEERYVSGRRARELEKQQEGMGFIAPEAFDRMSYVMRNPRNYWNFGDVGYVWCHDFRRKDLCEEFFNRPFVIWNGNVEACGNCNTFNMGNVFHKPFREIWNCDLYQEVRRRMYEGEVDSWFRPCHDCICMHVTYDRATSDHRFVSFYRVVDTEGRELPKEEADCYHIPPPAPSFAERLKPLREYVPPKFHPFARKVYREIKKYAG